MKRAEMQRESFDDALDALRNRQRRELLLSLLDHNPQHVSGITDGGVESRPDTVAMDRLVTLRHVHMPKLVEYGFVEWDEETREARKGPNFEEIRPLLELLANHEDELPDGWL